MGLFSDNKSQTQANGLVRVDVRDDGFTLHKQSSAVRNGDTLLVSYNTDGKHWTHVAVEFYDRKEGIFVYTEDRPKQIVVQQQAKKGQERSRQSSSEHDRRTTYTEDTGIFGFNDPFSIMNLMSPFHPLNIGNTMNLYDTGNPYRAPAHETPSPFPEGPGGLSMPPVPGHAPDTNAPSHHHDAPASHGALLHVIPGMIDPPSTNSIPTNAIPTMLERPDAPSEHDHGKGHGADAGHSDKSEGWGHASTLHDSGHTEVASASHSSASEPAAYSG